MIKIFLIAFLGTATPVLAVIDPMAAGQWNLASKVVPLGSQPSRSSRIDHGEKQGGSFSVTFSRPSSLIVQEIGIRRDNLGLVTPVVFPELKRPGENGAANTPVVAVGALLPNHVTTATIDEPASGLIMGLILFLLVLALRPRRVPGSTDVLAISKP